MRGGGPSSKWSMGATIIIKKELIAELNILRRAGTKVSGLDLVKLQFARSRIGNENKIKSQEFVRKNHLFSRASICSWPAWIIPSPLSILHRSQGSDVCVRLSKDFENTGRPGRNRRLFQLSCLNMGTCRKSIHFASLVKIVKSQIICWGTRLYISLFPAVRPAVSPTFSPKQN